MGISSLCWVEKPSSLTCTDGVTHNLEDYISMSEESVLLNGSLTEEMLSLERWGVVLRETSLQNVFSWWTNMIFTQACSILWSRILFSILIDAQNIYHIDLMQLWMCGDNCLSCCTSFVGSLLFSVEVVFLTSNCCTNKIYTLQSARMHFLDAMLQGEGGSEINWWN